MQVYNYRVVCWLLHCSTEHATILFISKQLTTSSQEKITWQTQARKLKNIKASS